MKLLADVNAELKTVGRGELKLLPERRDIDGGFVYIDGGMEIDVAQGAHGRSGNRPKCKWPQYCSNNRL